MVLVNSCEQKYKKKVPEQNDSKIIKIFKKNSKFYKGSFKKDVYKFYKANTKILSSFRR